LSPGPDHGVWRPSGIVGFQTLSIAVALVAVAWDIAAAVSPAIPAPRVPPVVLLALSVLASERIRLPLQNTVAIGLLAGGAGWAAALAGPGPRPPLPSLVAAAALGVVAVPGARALVRELRRNAGKPRGWELPAITAALSVPLWESGRVGSSDVHARSPGTVVAEWALATVGSILLQAALTPWWIDKRRVRVPANPMAAVPWIACMIAALFRNAHR